MKIALLGYRRMGKAIATIAEERGHQIVAIVDPAHEKGTLPMADVAINFSVPTAAVANIKSALAVSVPVVCGTTGWLDHKPEVEAYCLQHDSAFLYASNFSVGVNLFFALNQYLAQLMQPYTGYKARMEEIHHIHKLDAPSGTAITLAEGLIEKGGYKQWIEDGHTPKENELPIQSIRDGEVPGTHSVHYESSIDGISIRHEAYNRKGFALGAVIAAEWIVGKKGIFEMADVISLSKEDQNTNTDL